MRALFATALMIAGSSSALAQGQTSPSPFPGYASARLEAENRANMNTRRVEECLVRKDTGKRECHTRAEWRKIAANLSEKQQRLQ